MKLYFLPFFATVISFAESSLRANVFADEAERELGQLDDRPAVLASDADEGEGRRLCDRKCRRKKRRERRNKGDDDDDDDDKDGGDSSGGKRLQLYCETKFEWQGKAKCPSYCLEVSSCKSGAGLRVKKCGGTSKQKWKRDGSVIRPSCSSSLYLSDGEVKKGSSSVDFSSSGKFEIRKSGRCLTQMHHPRDGEPVEFRSCSKARKSNTSKWVWK